MRELFVSMMKLLAWLSPFVLAVCGQFIGIRFMDGPNSWMGFFGFGLGLGVGGLCWVLFTGLVDLAETVWGNKRAAAIHAKLHLKMNAYRDQEVVSMIQRFSEKPNIEFKVLNQVRAYKRRRYMKLSQDEHASEEDIRNFADHLYGDFAEGHMEDFERLYALGVLDLVGVYCFLAAYHGAKTWEIAKDLDVPEETWPSPGLVDSGLYKNRLTHFEFKNNRTLVA